MTYDKDLTERSFEKMCRHMENSSSGPKTYERALRSQYDVILQQQIKTYKRDLYYASLERRQTMTTNNQAMPAPPAPKLPGYNLTDYHQVRLISVRGVLEAQEGVACEYFDRHFRQFHEGPGTQRSQVQRAEWIFQDNERAHWFITKGFFELAIPQAKPCPFCGAPDPKDQRYRLCCDKCGATGPGIVGEPKPNKHERVQRWNRRS